MSVSHVSVQQHTHVSIHCALLHNNPRVRVCVHYRLVCNGTRMSVHYIQLCNDTCVSTRMYARGMLVHNSTSASECIMC